MKFLLIIACIEYGGNGIALMVQPAETSMECEKRGDRLAKEYRAEGKTSLWICHDIRSFAGGK